MLKKALFAALIHPLTNALSDVITRDLAQAATPPLFDGTTSLLCLEV